MRPITITIAMVASTLLASATVFSPSQGPRHEAVVENARNLIDEGREAFRHDTFGSEAFWGDTLRLHHSIAGAGLGGVGPGVSPRIALAVGLKVDVEELRPQTRQALRKGHVNLDDPAVTVELLRQEAVVGVKGFFDGPGQLVSVGISCALCHSTVNDSLAPGIGHRLDGWPNRDLDVGTVISLAPDLSHFTNLLGVSAQIVRTVLTSWGPGRFDAHLLLDGRAFRPDSGSASVVIPAAFGLGGVNLATYNGWGGIAHWNAFVGTLEMGGKGTLYEPRLDDPLKYPVAAAHGLGHLRSNPDRVTDKLAALQMYQLALPVPEPPASSFDPVAAARGRTVFAGRADCARCHVPGIFTEPGFNMHTAAEIGIDDFQARRGPWDRYRTTPLRGLFTKTKGGFYHDGRFHTLRDVVDHYDSHFMLWLSPGEKADLVEYLKSL